MTKLPIIFVFLSILISSSLACFCTFRNTTESFCNSDWVSHVLVKSKTSKPNGAPEPGARGPTVVYKVEHKHVFRSENITGDLPENVYSPAQEAACGITLKVNTEYLLSGSVRDGKLWAYLCGQVLPKGYLGMVAVWKDLPKGFSDTLENIDC